MKMSFKQLLRLVGSFGTLIEGAVGSFVRNLIVVLPFGLLGALSLAVAVWVMSETSASLSSTASANRGIVLVICYSVAGVIWACHRSCLAAANHVVQSLAAEAPALIRKFFDTLAFQNGMQPQQLKLAEIQRAFGSFDLADALSGSKLSRSGGSRDQLLRIVFQRLVANELKASLAVWKDLEQRAQKGTTVESVTTYLSEKISAVLANIAHAQTRGLGIVSAVIVFLLIAIPAILPHNLFSCSVLLLTQCHVW